MTARATSCGLLIAAFACIALVTGTEGAERRLLVFENADYAGFDYATHEDVDLEACKQACLGDEACKAFTYNESARYCFLKNDFGRLTTFEGATSGRVAAGAPAPEAAPSLDLSFLPEGIADEARRLERAISALPGAEAGHGAAISAASAALAGGDPRAAAADLKSALALDPGNFSAWVSLARALVAIEPADYSERWDLPEEASAAAFNAIGLATDDRERALALAVLASVLERRELWRPAIETYKASLALLEAPTTRDDYDRVRAAHGFRMVDYSVDADAAAPRACVQFSEELANGGVDIADYVTLNGVRPDAVTREAQQVCVDGLVHGERYRLGLRAGLPAEIGETLEEPVELSFYVRDRSPSVRFTGRNYVLPSTGAKGLPVVTINSALIEAEITRIGDRALAETLRDGEFLDQLSGYDADDLADWRGERVWQGEMPVNMDLNREVVTAFPVDDVLGSPEPGVYVMTARATESTDEDWNQRATQWFIVTDLGLATLMGEDGLHVFARSLASASPLGGLEVSLIAAGNDVLATTSTDEAGHALFAPGLTRGEGGMEPALIIAEGGGDAAFLDLAAAPFDLTDRGVDGRPAPAAIDVFAYTDRGVYRPGETVHFMALARDGAARAVEAPLTIIIERPDGVEFERITKGADIGGHAHDITLGADALTGTWQARVHSDPEAAALSETRFLVEDFVPERLDFEIETTAEMAETGSPLPVSVTGNFLYGAPAAGLGLEGEVTVRPAESAPQAFARYRFGIADEELVPTRDTLTDLPATDSTGAATFDARLPSPPQTTGLLEADIVLRMRESGGRAVERSLTLPVRPSGPLVGVRPLFDGDAVEEGSLAGFEVIGVSADLERADLGAAEWELVRLERSYEWYRYDGRWNYEAVTRTSRIDNGEIALGTDAPARIDVPVEWGRYRLEVTAAGSGAATSIEFSAGWYAADAEAETPDILEVSLDRETYRPGETATVRLTPRFAGTALVTVMAERVLAMQAVDVAADGTTVDFTVDEDWGAGAYVTAMLYRPMDVDAGQNPARAIGIDWLKADTLAREITVDMQVPEIADPRSTLAVPVTLGGLDAGEPARLTLAAVDAGILNLTGFEPPEPEGWYYGQRSLGVEIRDLYGRLINGLQGTRGQVRSGGGESGLSMSAAPKTEKPVALFSGVVAADADGRAEVTFDLPAFNGTLRLMAVAWSAAKVGHGTTDVIVRDPVVVTASLPRFLTPGDASRLWLDIDNVSGPAGAWTLDVAIDGPVESASGALSLDIAAGERRAVAVPLDALSVGDATVALTLTHADGMEIARAFDLPVHPSQPPVTRRSVQTLAAGSGRLTITPDLVADMVPGSSVVTLAARRGLLVDVPGILDALDRYPYGCAEQITSRAMPLVYLNDVAKDLGIAADEELNKRIDEAIVRVLQRQSANGSFGLWRAGGDDLWLDAYVSDFLTRAREAGHAVPSRPFEQALDRLENGLAYIGEVSGDGEDVAYALYVLARNRRASIGDLRYFADAKLDDFGSPLARAQLGAALNLYGEAERATRAFRAALSDLQEVPSEDDGWWREDYGSPLRDSAATLALAAETRARDIALPAIARVVERERETRTYTNTQENAWMLLAAHALASEDDGIVATLDGAEHRGRLLRQLTDEAVRAGALTIANSGTSDFDAVVTVTGVPLDPEPARANGLTITRSTYTLDGEPVGTETVGQNERLVVVLTVTEQQARRARLLVEDFLPAGFEIDNPRLVTGGETGNLAWLGETAATDHVEFRDDRFAAALDRSGSEAETLTLAYIVRAVTPGRYTHPPALVEDMYGREFNARTAVGEIEIAGPEPR